MRLHDIPLLSGANRLGHLDQIRNDRLALLLRISREHGDIARILAVGTSIVVVNGPELFHEMMVEKVKSFVKSPGLRGPLRPLAGEGLFTAEGELWRRQRKRMAPLFTHAEIAGYASTMAECASEAVRDLREGQVLDVARWTTHIAMRIAGKALFDAETMDEADELGAALTVALSWVESKTGTLEYALQLRAVTELEGLAQRVSQPLATRLAPLFEEALVPVRWPGQSSREVAAALAVVERRVERMIAERRAALATGNARRDLLTMLLSAQDDDGARMSDKQVRDEVVTLFVAGHETTATSLAWSLYLLARHPEAYARARAEARSLGGRRATFTDLPALAYCQRVFKEAMRLYPPVYLAGRQASADVRLGAYDLPRNTVILISPFALHRRSELWPDPDRFDPGRFEPAAEEQRHRQAYLPFGAGPRICLGIHFALMEGPLVLATILNRVDLALATTATVEPDASATLRPKGGVPMRVTAVTAVADSPRPTSAP